MSLSRSPLLCPSLDLWRDIHHISFIANQDNAGLLPVEDPELLQEELISVNLQEEIISNATLVGCIRFVKIYNIKAVKEIMAKAWSSYSEIHISEVGKNMFLFSFQKNEDAIEVLRKCPWFVMSNLLCLEKWNPNVTYNELKFDKVPFWIQIHNLPLSNINVQNATKLLSKVGEVLEVENPIVRGVILRNFIRGRVDRFKCSSAYRMFDSKKKYA